MLTMEQIIEGVHTVPDEHSTSNGGQNNIQILSSDPVSKQDDNSLNQHTQRNVNKTSPLCGPGHPGELKTTTANPRDSLTAGVVTPSRDDQVTVIAPTISNTCSSIDDSMEDTDQSDVNYSRLDNVSASAGARLPDNRSEEGSAGCEAARVIGGDATSVAEDREHSDRCCSGMAGAGAFTLTRSKKVVDIPNNEPEYSSKNYEDELTSSVASSLSAMQSITEILSRRQQAEDSEVSDEDGGSESYPSRLSARHNVNITHNALGDEGLVRAKSVPKEIPVEKVVGTVDETRDEHTNTSEKDVTSSVLTQSGNGTCRVVKSETADTDCKQLAEDMSKVKMASTCTEKTRSENPKQVVDTFTSKVRKNIVPKFKELDAPAKSDNSCEPPSETPTDAPYKAFASGRKYGGVSLIINKYNTLLDGAAPPSDKDKFKPKSTKVAHNKDASSCNRCADEESRASTNENTPRDDLQMSCDQTKGTQENNQEGDTVFNDSRTDIPVDCLRLTRPKNTCEDEEIKPSDPSETCERCDTNRNCGDISLTMAGNLEIENKDVTRGDEAANNRHSLTVEKEQENKLPDKSTGAAALVEEVCERNIVESPSESNSIWLGSTVDSLDERFADDEFSSQEEFRGFTPTSPVSVDENETFYRMGAMCREEARGNIVVTKSGGTLDDRCTKDEGGLGKYEENACTVPHLGPGNLVVNTCQINNDGISLPSEGLEGNDIKVFCENSSRAVSPADERRMVCNSPERLDGDDKEFVYLDAESGDLNEQSEASWEQLVSCCNSGNQSCSENVQECVQLFANEDMRSNESGSVYDDVASGSHHEYSSVRNASDGRNLKYVSSYCSENESCSNFYSEEGDHKQSDTHDGYLSALDIGEDPDIFRSTEHLDCLDGARGSNNCGQGGDTNDDKIPVIDEHDDISTEPPLSPEGEQFMDCMHEDTATRFDNVDVEHEITDTKAPQLIEEENEHVTKLIDANECVKEIDLITLEDTTLHTEENSIGPDEESDFETKNVIPSAEDKAETTSEKQTFTNEEPDCLPSEGNRLDNKEESAIQKCVMDMVEQVATHEDDRIKEEDVVNESIVGDESNGQEICLVDESVAKITVDNEVVDKVESELVVINVNTVCNGDNSSAGGHSSVDTSVDNANGSGTSTEEDLEDLSSEQLSTHDASQEGTTNEEDSEALASDGEDDDDGETKAACCEEFQLMWKRMKRLKKAMESLNEQVSREKLYLEQEVDRYKNMPEMLASRDLSLFERKLAEVQRERRLGERRVTQEEYWRRLREADQMCGEEIEQMNVAEEKLRHLTRITDVWMRTNVVLPYYDPPSLELAAASAPEPEVSRDRVDELATEVVDLMGPADAYMTSWLIDEADRMKANSYSSTTGDTTTRHRQNFNDLSVDQMLLPPHLLKKLEALRDVVKANSLSAEISQNINRSDEEKLFLSNLRASQDLLLNQSMELENQNLVPEKTDNNSEYSATSGGN